jgi:hypothetical protein
MKQLIVITAMLLAMTAKLVAQNKGTEIKNHQSKNEVVNQKN